MERERTEISALAAEFVRDGELVVGAAWDGSSCRVTLHQRENAYIVVFQKNPEACEILIETWRDGAFSEFVDAITRVGRLPARIEGESDVAEWCRGAAGLGDEVSTPAEAWASWYRDAIAEIS